MARFKVPLKGALLVDAESPEAAARNAEQIVRNMPLVFHQSPATLGMQGCKVDCVPDGIEFVGQSANGPVALDD